MKVGDLVQVRSKAEILATLDDKGQLDGMPFMPEMLKFCGQRFKVFKVAHKACDTVFPVRLRAVSNAIHLDLRCDGQAHGGCQASCLLYWKEAWLIPVGRGEANTIALPRRSEKEEPGADELRKRLEANAVRIEPDGVPAYTCQATQLPYASTHLDWWDIRHYIRDYTSGNIPTRQFLDGVTFAAYHGLSEAGIGLGRPLRWLWGKISFLWGGSIWPRSKGLIPPGQKTPEAVLNLQPGELVRVKPLPEILKTVTTDYKNRGLMWDPEFAPFCGKTYRVLRRVTQILDEKTGRMLTMKNACIILDSVVCEARYNTCRTFCPRSIYPYWREIWLERVAETRGGTPSTGQDSPARNPVPEKSTVA